MSGRSSLPSGPTCLPSHESLESVVTRVQTMGRTPYLQGVALVHPEQTGQGLSHGRDENIYEAVACVVRVQWQGMLARSMLKPALQAFGRALACLLLLLPSPADAGGSNASWPFSRQPPYKCDGGVYRRDGAEVRYPRALWYWCGMHSCIARVVVMIVIMANADDDEDGDKDDEHILPHEPHMCLRRVQLLTLVVVGCCRCKTPSSTSSCRGRST